MTSEAHSGHLHNSQLFLDDRLLEDYIRVQRVWHQPQKYPEPVMKRNDPWQMQYYSLTPFRYEGIWLAGLLRMHTIPDVLEEELVWSYDARNWHRSITREPFIPRGPQGSFDSVWAMPERDNLAVQAVTWKEGRSARQLAGKRIRLFFESRDAPLYSFRAGSS